jgi:hypothetical protein
MFLQKHTFLLFAVVSCLMLLPFLAVYKAIDHSE